MDAEKLHEEIIEAVMQAALNKGDRPFTSSEIQKDPVVGPTIGILRIEKCLEELGFTRVHKYNPTTSKTPKYWAFLPRKK